MTDAEQSLSSHERMRLILTQIASESGDNNLFVGDKHARKLRSFLADQDFVASLPPLKKWELNFELGKAELKLGREEDALAQLRKAEELLPSDAPLKNRKQTWYELGVSALRFGETQNCCLQNSSESCIVPIRGRGLHTRQQGSRLAIEFFTRVLQHPAKADEVDEQLELDEAARWLLNVAYMTVGEYPQGVPEEYRVAPGFFESSVDFPRFENVYPRLGMDTFNLCGGVVIDDLDGDCDLDIITCTWDVAGQMKVFRNNCDGTFDDVTEAAGLKGFFGGLNLNQADFDNDGDLDIYIMRGAWLKSGGRHPNSLLRNDGNLKFTDVTFAVGLDLDFLPTKTAAWADYDRDGDLDLYVGNETTSEIESPCRLYRNDGERFVDVARAAGVDDQIFSMGGAWGDYNGDGWPDLYLSVSGPNRLYRNNKDGTFTDVAEELGVTRPEASFSTWFWDYDNDGHQDIYVGCTSGPVGVLNSTRRFELMHLYHNRGDGTFENVAPKVNLQYPASPMGSNYGDLNNDGFLDFYLATGNVPFSEIQPNVMFLNDGGSTFHNVTMAGGFGHLQKGHGVSFADIDNDGDQDVYVQLGGAYPADRFNDALFANPGFPNRSVTLQLEGRKSNRCAIGTKFRIDITDADGKRRSIHRTVSSGSSFGANPLRQTVGLGSSELIDELTIQWSSSEVAQTVKGLKAGAFYRITEGEEPVSVPLTVFRIGELDRRK